MKLEGCNVVVLNAGVDKLAMRPYPEGTEVSMQAQGRMMVFDLRNTDKKLWAKTIAQIYADSKNDLKEKFDAIGVNYGFSVECDQINISIPAPLDSQFTGGEIAAISAYRPHKIFERQMLSIRPFMNKAGKVEFFTIEINFHSSKSPENINLKARGAQKLLEESEALAQTLVAKNPRIG